MEFSEKILRHEKYLDYLSRNASADATQKLCRHDLQHALDVARVAYIVALENSLQLSKDIIYSAALLHDIAKWKQYREGVDHAAEGAALAEEILRDIGMNAADTILILDAIRTHRVQTEADSPLSDVIYKGDKLSRFCLQCKHIGRCNRFQDGRRPVLSY